MFVYEVEFGRGGGRTLYAGVDALVRAFGTEAKIEECRDGCNIVHLMAPSMVIIARRVEVRE